MMHVTVKCPTANVLFTVYRIGFSLSLDQLHDVETLLVCTGKF